MVTTINNSILHIWKLLREQILQALIQKGKNKIIYMVTKVTRLIVVIILLYIYIYIYIYIYKIYVVHLKLT